MLIVLSVVTPFQVIHGADWDILYLQRDLSLRIYGEYVHIQLSKNSLAFLLKYCCDADKSYQVVDWKIRWAMGVGLPAIWKFTL